MSVGRSVTFVVPEAVGEEGAVSGGNVFDLRLRDELSALGWEVRFAPVATDAAAPALAEVGDGGLVLIDGLVAGRSAAAVEAESSRLVIVMLAHMVSSAFPDVDAEVIDGERRTLRTAARVVATSAWTASELVRSGAVDELRVAVARPGCDDASPAAGTRGGGSVLCVGVVAPHKGQDVLVEALAALPPTRAWSCTIAGSRDAHPEFARRVEARARSAGIADRVRLRGVLDRAGLDRAYHAADVVVAPSRVESYGMAVAEALRRGIPVVASDVGGIPEAVAGSRAAVLVPPGDAGALAGVLQRWMAGPALRDRLTAEARRERPSPPTWRETAVSVAAVLEEAAR